MLLEVLYKRTSTGAIQTWRQETNEAGDSYRTISGQLDGKLVTSAWTLCQPKNVGKVSETSPQVQCQSEVAANYTKKLKQGCYVRSLDEVDEVRTIYKPMLAKKYSDYTSLVTFDGTWFSQPKLDGLRCVNKADGNWSREGEPIPTCPHFIEALKPIRAPDTLFDGEIYTDRLADDFNALVSLAKRKDPSTEDLERSTAQLQYHLYDIPSLTGVPFSERTEILRQAIESLGPQNILVYVETTPITSQEQMDELYAGYLEAGQEGQMLRNGASLYQPDKRSKDLLKRKEFIDGEFEVLDVIEGVGNRSGMAGKVECLLPDGQTFKAAPKGKNSLRVEMLKRRDELIGKQATVRYFTPTPDGIPRFPVLVIIHETARW